MKDNLAIITPSYINSEQRYEFSKKSLDSLYQHLKSRPKHIVIDDIPTLSEFGGYIPNLKLINKANKLYNAENILLKRRYKQGGFEALLEAAKTAKELGKEYVYIHLDDCIYLDKFDELVDKAISALSKRDNLQMVRISGFPLITKKNSLEKGNQSFLSIEGETLKFDKLTLKKQSIDDFSLWYTEFSQQTISDEFWPIILWGSVYKTDFVIKFLTESGENNRRRLGGIERYYYDNWDKVYETFEGMEFGYINMQFGLFEMHRNKNWEELIQMSNQAVK